MDEVLFYHVSLAFLFIGVGVFCSIIPLITNDGINKRGFAFYFSGGGLLAFSMNFFEELEPPGLDIPIKYASNTLAILGFLVILSLSTITVVYSGKGEYSPVDVEDGSLNIEIDEIEMMLSDKVRSTPSSVVTTTSSSPSLSSLYSSGSMMDRPTDDAPPATISITVICLVVLSYLNFLIGFWLSTKNHTGYKDLIVAITNHCLLATALSAVIVSLHGSNLPRFFWPFVLCLSCAAPVGIILGTQYSLTYSGSGGYESVRDPYMHFYLKVSIHLGLCVCRGMLLYIASICMVSHSIMNKNYNRVRNVVAVVCGSLLFILINEF